MDFCAGGGTDFCNIGSKPTFQTRKRSEVLDLTLVNRNAWDWVCDWHVSDVPSLSDHMYIRFKIKESIKQPTKMIRNVRITCWERFEEKLAHRINECNVLLAINSKEDIETTAAKLQSVIITSYEESCPLSSASTNLKNLVEFRHTGLPKKRKANKKTIKWKLKRLGC